MGSTPIMMVLFAAVAFHLTLSTKAISRSELISTKFKLEENKPTYTKSLDDPCTSTEPTEDGKRPFDECMQSSMSIIKVGGELQLEVGKNNQAMFCKNSVCKCLEVGDYVGLSSPMYRLPEEHDASSKKGNNETSNVDDDLACFLTGLKDDTECISQIECAEGFHCDFNADMSMGANKLVDLESVRRFCASWAVRFFAVVPMIAFLAFVAVYSA